MNNEDYKALDLRETSVILLCLCLTNNVLVNMHKISILNKLWEKFEELYKKKGIWNQVYFKEQFYTLQMSKYTIILDYLSVFNGIIYEL